MLAHQTLTQSAALYKSCPGCAALYSVVLEPAGLDIVCEAGSDDSPKGRGPAKGKKKKRPT
ncbi:hypothetical protein E2C01_087954 [Portunus trituberculatus]|uniref:Uncharacterized protein n=1 Tax=Portunus trituberculatus TaxID=210409 RepID=A0A5B7JEQ2_PORTR|nr:hypothetical protein [Portunus trituberculatus]